MEKKKEEIVAALDAEMKELGAKARAMHLRVQKIQAVKNLLSDTDDEFNKVLLAELAKEK